MCISHPGKYRIPWLDEIPDLNKVVDLGTYGRAHSGVEVEGFVYLQVEVAPPYALLEAREIADLSLSHPKIAGIVPWAPLETATAADTFWKNLFRSVQRSKVCGGSSRANPIRSSVCRTISCGGISCSGSLD